MDKKHLNVKVGNKDYKRNRGFKSVGFIIVLILFGLIVFAAYNQPSKLKEVPLSEVVEQTNKGVK